MAKFRVNESGKIIKVEISIDDVLVAAAQCGIALSSAEAYAFLRDPSISHGLGERMKSAAHEFLSTVLETNLQRKSWDVWQSCEADLLENCYDA